jgi:hypothetical protein
MSIWVNKPFDRLMVLNRVEGLATMSQGKRVRPLGLFI